MILISTGTIGIVLATILVPILLSFLAKRFPLDESQTYDFEYLYKTYKKWDSVAIVALLFFSGILTFVWYGIIHTIADLSFGTLKKGILTAKTIDEYWFFPAFFLAILSSVFPLMVLFKAVLKDKYKEYIAYSNSLYKADGFRALKAVSFILIPICIIVIFLGMNWYTIFTPAEFYKNGYFSLNETVHQYSDTKAIYKIKKFKAPNGNIVEEPYYIIVFIDGYKWSQRDDPVEIGDFETKVLKYIYQKSGKKVENIEYESEIR